MEDYKELVEKLKDWDEFYISNICGSIGFNCKQFCVDAGRECILVQAIKAIENLIAERDALHDLAKKNHFHNMKECAHYEKCFQIAVEKWEVMRCCGCEKWKWRGLNKESGEQDAEK